MVVEHELQVSGLTDGQVYGDLLAGRRRKVDADHGQRSQVDRRTSRSKIDIVIDRLVPTAVCVGDRSVDAYRKIQRGRPSVARKEYGAHDPDRVVVTEGERRKADHEDHRGDDDRAAGQIGN